MAEIYDAKYIEGSSYMDALFEINNGSEFSVFKQYVECYKNDVSEHNRKRYSLDFMLSHAIDGVIGYDFSIIIKYVKKAPETKEELLKDINIKVQYHFIIEEDFDDIICTRIDKFRWKICTIFSRFPKPFIATVFSNCNYKFIVTQNISDYVIETLGVEEKIVLAQTNIKIKIASVICYKIHIKDKIYYVNQGVIFEDCEEVQTMLKARNITSFKEIYDGNYF